MQEIAIRLGLPICIKLSYVPKGFSSSTWSDLGIEGTIAQVSIPQNLPRFGSPGLQGYPIQVRISENCHDYPDTFIYIMIHELSHVLLASIDASYKDSELHTDLIPILLGFRDVVRRGRKIIESTTNHDMTRITRYGYLTDLQFGFAYKYVMRILRGHLRDKTNLVNVIKKVQRQIKKSERSLATFHDYFEYLDRYPAKKMRIDHAQRVVQLHGKDYSHEWKTCITSVNRSLEIAESFVCSLSQYTSITEKHIKEQTRIIELASKEAGQITEAITKDVRILGKYVKFGKI